MGQFGFIILVAPCCMEAPWLSVALNMKEDIPHWGPAVKDFTKDVLVVWLLNGLPSLHLNFWLLRDMCYSDKGSLPQSVRQWQGQLKHLQGFTSNVCKNRQVSVLEMVTTQCRIYPLVAMFFVKLSSG